MTRASFAAVVCLAAASAGCALTSRSEPMQIRYFSVGEATSERAPSPGPAASHLSLRLERVRSGAHLVEEIAYRDGVHELGYYEDRRWTEKPEAFLERALERALFQERGLTRVVGGASQALAVELVAFEEVRGSPPSAVVEVNVTLHDDRASQLERTIRVERVIPNTGKDATSRAVAALSQALDATVEQIAQLVTERLAALAGADATVGPAPAAEAAAH